MPPFGRHRDYSHTCQPDFSHRSSSVNSNETTCLFVPSPSTTNIFEPSTQSILTPSPHLYGQPLTPYIPIASSPYYYHHNTLQPSNAPFYPYQYPRYPAWYTDSKVFMEFFFYNLCSNTLFLRVHPDKIVAPRTFFLKCGHEFWLRWRPNLSPRQEHLHFAQSFCGDLIFHTLSDVCTHNKTQIDHHRRTGRETRKMWEKNQTITNNEKKKCNINL